MVRKVNVWVILIPFLHQVLADNAVEEAKFNQVRQLKLALGYPLDSLLNFTELATEYGYESEQHSVTTQDGYILTVFRITRGKNCIGPIRQPPVILMHGLLMSSDSFMDSGPKSGLAYLIADACYDVWAPNVRGNYYSRKHIKLNPNGDPEYWKFYNYEYGAYDLPAIIDYIQNYTMSEKVNYIGYSQGGAIFFILNSVRPEYREKLGVGILLEPGSRHTYTRSMLFRLLGDTYLAASPYLYSIDANEALPLGGPVQTLAAFFCKDYNIADTACRFALGLIDTFHPGSIKTETIQVLFGHFPAGTSVKSMAWYGQALNADKFQRFDYGPSRNIQLYGTIQPKAYNLSEITVPVVVIHGRNDYLTSPADVEWVTKQLPNVLEDFYVEDPLWDHFDVTYSQFTKESIFPKIEEYLLKFSEIPGQN